MGTSRAQSIATSRAQSRKTSRRESMDDMEPVEKVVPRSKGGKIINKLQGSDVRDSNQMEQIPDPFGAEQTYISEDEINQALAKSKRKGSMEYEDLDQEMTGEPSANLQDMFDNMQISVVGGKGDEEVKSVAASESSDSEYNEDDHFKEDLNKIS